MKRKSRKKQLSFLICALLVAMMALLAAGCNGGKKDSAADGNGAESQTEGETPENGGQPEEGTPEEGNQPKEGTPEEGSKPEGNVLGEGKAQFTFITSDQDGKETSFEIHTDKETVGEALQELGLIDGEEGEYGLYVKSVNGITADYDTDGAYWAFYVDGEYGMTGVDETAITEGSEYALRYEKGE